MQRFSQLSSWLKYRQILLQEFGVRLRMEPKEHFTVIRGHNVRIDEWAAVSAARGTVVFVHGAGGNGRIVAPFAEPIAHRGWRVLAPDLPGFGLTIPARTFDWNYAEWPEVIADLAMTQEGPVVLIGASIGGLIAVLAAQKAGCVAGVVTTSLLDLSDNETFIRLGRCAWLGRLSLLAMRTIPKIFDRIRLPLSLVTPLRSMSSKPAMQSYFVEDRLIGRSWKPGRFFRTANACIPPALRLQCPLLVVHPGRDTWTPTALSAAVFEKVEAPKEFVVLKDGAHLPVEPRAILELTEIVGAFLDKISPPTLSTVK